MTHVVDQPPPVPNDRPAIQDLVIADIVERKRIGVERYGVPLQSFNGRRALVDGYQEALDLAQYLRQEIDERMLIDAVVAASQVWRCSRNLVEQANADDEETALVEALDNLLAAGAVR